MAMLDTTLQTLIDYLSDANRRTFGVYLLSALVLALPAFIIHRRTSNQVSFLGYLFNRKVWWHPSARLDYLLFIANRIIRIVLWAPIVLTMIPVAMGLSDALDLLFGPVEPVVQSAALIMGIFTLLLFLLDDLSRFLLHLALHKVPWLWEFHKIHHSAKVLTPMTIYRTHPLESYLYACRLALSQGVAVGIGYFLFGPSLSMFDILGANVFVFIFNVMGANLRHSHVRWSWGNALEKWFISPAQHQIHHSDNPLHFDRNLGSALALWDRLAGTLIVASEAPRIRFGLGRGQAAHRSLWQCYLAPFQALLPRRKKGRTAPHQAEI